MVAGRLERDGWFAAHDAQRPRPWSLDPKVLIDRALACTACGYVEVFLDPERLRSYLKGEDDGGRRRVDED
jgi:hypothetical protein